MAFQETLQDLYKEMLAINEWLDSADARIQRLNNTHYIPSTDELQMAWAERSMLEVEQERARARFNVVARPMIRDLNVLDLPNELLLKIFGHLEDLQAKMQLESDKPLKWIQESRLVCHRFNNLGSQFLIRVVRVAPNMDSVGRLEAISRHPTISLGVTEVWLALSLHSPDLDDSEAFSSYLFSALKKACDPWDVYVSLDDLIHRHLLESPSASAGLVQELFAKYQEVMRTERFLMVGPGRFGPRVAESVARMPRARNLAIYDCGMEVFSEEPGEVPRGPPWLPGERPDDDKRRLEEVFLRDTNFLTWDHVEEFMLQPIVDQHHRILPPDYTYRPIYPLLTSLQASGVRLNDLEISLARPTNFAQLNAANADDHWQLTGLVQRLKRFSFGYYGTNRNFAGDDPADVDGIHQFLAAILDTSSLERLELDAYGGIPSLDPQMMGMIDLTEVTGTGRSRQKLQHLDLNWVTADAARFRAMLAHSLPPSMTTIRLADVALLVQGSRDRGILEDAWRDVLDELRKKKPTTAEVISPNGPAVVGFFKTAQHGRIFDIDDSRRHPRISEDEEWINNASYYVLSGSGGYEFPNPFDLYHCIIVDDLGNV